MARRLDFVPSAVGLAAGIGKGILDQTGLGQHKYSDDVYAFLLLLGGGVGATFFDWDDDAMYALQVAGAFWLGSRIPGGISGKGWGYVEGQIAGSPLDAPVRQPSDRAWGEVIGQERMEHVGGSEYDPVQLQPNDLAFGEAQEQAEQERSRDLLSDDGVRIALGKGMPVQSRQQARSRRQIVVDHGPGGEPVEQPPQPYAQTWEEEYGPSRIDWTLPPYSQGDLEEVAGFEAEADYGVRMRPTGMGCSSCGERAEVPRSWHALVTPPEALRGYEAA